MSDNVEISKSHWPWHRLGGEIEASLREGVLSEEDDGKSKVETKEIFPPFFFCFFGLYPWRDFLCLRSEARSQVRKMQSVESLQICLLSPVLTNKMHYSMWVQEEGKKMMIHTVF